MPYRDEVEALRARVASLELEGRELREALERARAALASVTAELAGRPAKAPVPWRSLRGGVPARVAFLNRTPRTLSISSLGYDGRERREATLVSGGRLELPTQTGRLLRARDGDAILWQGYAREGLPEVTLHPP